MKTAWLLHGTGGSSTDYFWFADTKKHLESKGYKVWWPLLPNTEKPELVESRNFIEDDDTNFVWTEETIIIAHSSACPLMLHLLQYFKKPVGQVILVSGFYQSIDNEGFSERMLQKEEYDWETIKQSVKEIILINSDNDPWGCDDKQAKPIAQKLEAPLIIATGQGHMGSGTYNQPYKEFTLIKRLLATQS
jgi:predicted alpha/beta hydrolase family esterase